MGEIILPLEDLELSGLGLRTRHRFRATVSASDTVEGSGVPIDVIVGRRQRPFLAVVAGVHGDEYDGVRAVQEFSHELAVDDVAGTLLLVPVANPFAYAAGTRRTPEDQIDLNRVFPGKMDGSLTHRLADLLVERLFRKADLVFTLHGASTPNLLAPWIEFLNEPGPTGRASYDAARASGFPALVGLPRLPGVLLGALGHLGIPVVEGEVGGRGTTRQENVDYYKDRVRAVAQHLQILRPSDAPVERTAEPRIWQLNDVPAGASGLFTGNISLLDEVRQDDILGSILDHFGNKVSKVRAPVTGVIGCRREFSRVRAEDTVAIVWSPEELKVDW